MRYQEIPPWLRNTVEHLDLPIYIGLGEGVCRPPAGLALGDTLMVLGLIRNQGRPLKLFLEPGPAADLAAMHPLVKEVARPEPGSGPEGLTELPVPRAGRRAMWVSRVNHRLPLPVTGVDRVRANPILAHSLHYGLERREDWPSVFVDPAGPRSLKGLLSTRRPTCVLYPMNPGREQNLWQDPAWWAGLIERLQPHYALVSVGGRDYGELGGMVDAALSMDDPASTLPDLAWLLGEVAAFAGRDGGLSHLAAAVNHNLAVVWDSMASYRWWAGGRGHHLVFSNPYSFRYPQVARLNLDDIKREVTSLHMPDGQGGWREIALPRDGYEQKARELFGDLDNFGQAVQAVLEDREERGCLASWLGRPELKDSFYRRSQDFAARALTGGMAPGECWVAPVSP